MDGGVLTGKSVVVTRAAAQAPAMVEALQALGADVVELPTIRFADPEDGGAALRAGLARLDTYDWLLLSSTNTVERVAAELPRGPRATIPVAAIGERTAAAAAAAGFDVQLVPDEFVGEGLLAVMPSPTSDGGSVLFPRAAIGRQTLLDGLRELGWQVDLVETYRTVPVDSFSDEERDSVRRADAVTFTSPSTFHAYLASIGPPQPLVVSIGPVTTAAIVAAGYRVDIEADPHTVDQMVAALALHWSPPPR